MYKNTKYFYKIFYLVYFLNKITFFDDDNDSVLKKNCQGGLVVSARVGDLVTPLTLKMP